MSQSTPQLSAEATANLPTHVAVIMDGNGRWAKQRGLPRVEGHRQGAESVKAVVKTAGELGIKFVTLYAFSVENWNRPKDEVDTLMKYLLRFLKREVGEMRKNNIRLQAIGQIWRLPENIQEQLAQTVQATAKNNGITLTLALSYGGRTEIVDAVRQIAKDVKDGRLDPAEINEQVIAHHLYTHGTPDPDLLIRTSGELRVSNFLLWQISYAEFVVTETLWPDFGRREFIAALEEYSKRQRRYGGV
ncbi:MAG TPA: isoprenyl transferase [Verrucomicrobiales bacterium]|nr:isoprenyl transferase [Verrucomicrobiales bacterium]